MYRSSSLSVDSCERPDAAAVLRSSFDEIDVTDDDAVGCGEGDCVRWTSNNSIYADDYVRNCECGAIT